MQRVRRAAQVALVFVVALCFSSLPAAALPFSATQVRAATVPWPASTLVVSEVQTGGASASDEFVEIANQGAGPVDLSGLELVYATSSGSTVTRKATWTTPTILEPGRRTLVVNSVGSYVGQGDATYSGGFAATGGALALRVVGGNVIDAIGWGDASNAFVEGTGAPAPPASSSLERRPGGGAGNGFDTNDNLVDWFVATPNPQNLVSPPVPMTDPTPDPDPTTTPSPTPEPTATPDPTATPTPEPTPDPTATQTPEPTPDPTATPTATPSPSPTPSLTPDPTGTPAPTVPIVDARTLPDGTTVTVVGVLTTDLGALEAGRGGFIEDDTGGIAIYLDAAVATGAAIGTSVIARGTLDDRFAQRTIRAAEADVLTLGPGTLPVGAITATGAATEAVEGRRIAVAGEVVAGPDILSDGTAVTIDDGSGRLRVIVTPMALGGRVVALGSRLTAIGPLGQRDSTGTGAEGYRLFVVSAADLIVEPAPTPTPTPVPTSTPTASPTSSPGPDPTPTSTPSPSPTPSVIPSPSAPTIAAIRARPVGSRVTVAGTVTAEPGRLGTPALFAIGDASGGIVIKLPTGVSPPSRGQSLIVTGALADPYGQLEIRPAAADVTFIGTAPLPIAVDASGTGPTEATEGRLVTLTGTVTERPSRATSGDMSIPIELSDGTSVRLMADASSGLETASVGTGARYRFVGISGQRATKKGALDGYRVWLRDRHDIILLAGAPSATPSPSGGSGGSGGKASDPPLVGIASALRTTARDIAIEAVVTAGASLLDTSGRRIVVQDATAAIEVLLPKDGTAPPVRTRVRIVGRVGTAYGAPRLRAESLDRRGAAPVPAPLRLQGAVPAAHAWRLVVTTGRVENVRKLGDRWRAELAVGREVLVVVGQPGARIPHTTLGEGRIAEVVGIVRPPYPSAADKRPSILPRSRGDIRLADIPGSGASSGSAGSSGPAGASGVGRPSIFGDTASTDANASTVPDADLVDLGSHVGVDVRVGGLVLELRPDGFTLDDGTASGRIVLAGEAVELAGLIEPGDAVNVTGRVRQLADDELAVVVEDPAAIVLGGGLEGLAPAAPARSAEPDPAVASLGEAGALPGAGAGLVGIALVALASVAVTLLRRRHGTRFLPVRAVARLTRPAETRDPSGGRGGSSGARTGVVRAGIVRERA